MVTIQVKTGVALKQSTDALVIFHPQNTPFTIGVLGEVNTLLNGGLEAVLKQEKFKGKPAEMAVITSLGQYSASKILIVGLGEKTKASTDAFRKLGAQVMRRLKAMKSSKAVLVWPSALLESLGSREVMQAFCEGAWLGSYTFHDYKGKIHETQIQDIHEVDSLTIYESEKARVNVLERGLKDARAFAEATMLARTLVNTPPGNMLPQDLVKVAKQVASENKSVSIEILDEKKMERLGMQAALAVGRGSHHPTMGVHLVYKPAKKAKKRIALVGKAITFDSGGLSIKPADGMMTMKMDMAGAAAVIGVFQALPKLNLDVEVHGIFLAAENMPSGNAYRPGDVVRAMNGTTIEVLNTDAEGRVTLADALSYATTFEPDTIIDLATLTGACVVALGDDISGLMTVDQKLSEQLMTASKAAGENLWPLPLFQPYGELIKSKVADIKNIGGGRAGGALTAGLFLQHFVGKIPWAHLDIAGPAYSEKETRPDTPYGGTGHGVRTLLHYLQAIG